MNPDPRQHFLDHDRLGHVIDAAGFQPAHDVLGLRQSRHEDDRHVAQAGVALEPPAGFKTVHAGHHGVEQDDVGRDLVDDPHRGGAIHRDHHRHAGAVERVGQKPQRFRRVVDDERDIALFGFSDHSCTASSGLPCIDRDRSGRSASASAPRSRHVRVGRRHLLELELDRANVAHLPEIDQFLDVAALAAAIRSPASSAAAAIWSVSYCHSILSNWRINSSSLGISIGFIR